MGNFPVRVNQIAYESSISALGNQSCKASKIVFCGLEVRLPVGKIVIDNLGIYIKPNFEIVLRPRNTPKEKFNSLPSRLPPLVKNYRLTYFLF